MLETLSMTLAGCGHPLPQDLVLKDSASALSTLKAQGFPDSPSSTPSQPRELTAAVSLELTPRLGDESVPHPESTVLCPSHCPAIALNHMFLQDRTGRSMSSVQCGLLFYVYSHLKP